jgi:hypothetical protein
LPGIKKTQIGHLGRNEIVEVEYDPTQVSIKDMAKTLKQQSSFYSVITQSQSDYNQAKTHLDESDIILSPSSPHFIKSKHSLRSRHPEFLELELTEQQMIKLNSWSYFGGSMPDVLTKAQKEKLEQLQGEKPSVFKEIWDKIRN